MQAGLFNKGVFIRSTSDYFYGQLLIVLMRLLTVFKEKLSTIFRFWCHRIHHLTCQILGILSPDLTTFPSGIRMMQYEAY